MSHVEVLLASTGAAALAMPSGPVEPMQFLATDGPRVYFKDLPLSKLARTVSAELLAGRQAYKAQLFHDAAAALAANPLMADVPKCLTAEEAQSGICAIGTLGATALALPQAAIRMADVYTGHIPRIQSKRALVIGLNEYADARIPQLLSAVPDARAVSSSLTDELGYQVTRLENPSKADVVRAFNTLSSEMRDNDSLIVYFAGHGATIEKTSLGYWLPSDASAKDPSGWISNADVSRWLSTIRAKQVAVVSDSCYSGAFADNDVALLESEAPAIEAVLDKRSVTVLTSGSDEPVADTGKNGHSVFAWRLLQEMKALRTWSAGASVFSAVKTEVESELPQTPRYGSASNAGHESGGEFFFERRTRLR